MRFFADGDLAPLLAFFEDKLLPVLSNRDQGAPPKRPGEAGGVRRGAPAGRTLLRGPRAPTRWRRPPAGLRRRRGGPGASPGRRGDGARGV